MLIILSPAKTMDSLKSAVGFETTLPEYLKFAEQLAAILKMKSPGELSNLMKINPEIAQLTFERFQQWGTVNNKENAIPAIFSYIGEAFRGLDAESFSEKDLFFAQTHLRILSGLYGILRPLDLIQPYRLEMALKISTGSAKNLYDFWKKLITKSLKKSMDVQHDNVLINLASQEYFKSINIKELRARIITPVFKEYKNGEPVIVTVYAKKARGLMARFIIQNQLTNPEDLKLFDYEGYYFTPSLSTETEFTFTR
ncbi:MAG: peroxide stress protein YaaA [Bacteroidales bacterium]|nr:peroxide stress protein YaaA [Bacteroidales bacterium]